MGLILDSVAPAISGAQQGYAWFTAAMGNLADHIGLVLAALGVGSGVTILSWVLAGGLVLGATYKFKAVFFYGFIFLVTFAVVAGLGVKAWG